MGRKRLDRSRTQIIRVDNGTRVHLGDDPIEIIGQEYDIWRDLDPILNREAKRITNDAHARFCMLGSLSSDKHVSHDNDIEWTAKEIIALAFSVAEEYHERILANSTMHDKTTAGRISSFERGEVRDPSGSPE